MRSQNVEFPINGGQAPGYLARPDYDDMKPGVVVIQEWWGVNVHIKDIANRLAEQGYVALAPDLYHGVVVSEPNDAQKAAMELDRERAMREIDAAVDYLRNQTYVNPKQIGVIGFCMGGALTLYAGAHNPNVGAVAAFYGGGTPQIEEFAHSEAAILNIVGDKDRTLLGIQALDQGLQQYSLPHELAIYPGAQHAFFNDTRPEVYKPDAAKDAWQRALTWFSKYLV